MYSDPRFEVDGDVTSFRAVPEPAPLALLAVGGIGVLARRRGRRPAAR